MSLDEYTWTLKNVKLKFNVDEVIVSDEYKDFYSDDSLTWIPLDDKKSFFPIGVAYLPNQTYSQNTIELIELLRDL